MKNKFIAFSLAIIGICTVACRQSDESFDEDFKASKKSFEEPQMTARDSSATGMNPGDPPRNGTHWRAASENKENGKENPKDTPEKGSVIKKDSVINNTSIGIIGGNEGGDPPRNGTHWRTK